MMLRIIGYTEDRSEPVVAGVYKFYETFGLPLSVIIDITLSSGFIICWRTLILEGVESGIPPKRWAHQLLRAMQDASVDQPTIEIYELFREICQETKT
jgi:hypothetical protein